MLDVHFDKITVLEWYDGPVRAIGEAESGPYLAILAAWDMSTERKAYLIFKLDSACRSAILEALMRQQTKEENWLQFNQAYDRCIQNYTGDVFLLHGEMEIDRPLMLRKTDRQYLERFQDYDIENAFATENIEFWFRILRNETAIDGLEDE